MRFERALRAYLTLAGGLDEVLSYPFDFDPLLMRLGITPPPRVTLVNPISAEMPALRTHLGPSLLSVLEKNARVETELRIFELGRVFHPAATAGALPDQPSTLGALLAHAGAGADPDASLFFALKGLLAGLARAIGHPPLSVVQGGVDLAWAHPIRQARLVHDGRTLGTLAEVHPWVLHKLDVDHRAALFEVDIDAWRATPGLAPGYRPLDRFPAVYRDFAVVVPEAVRAEDAARAIRSAAPERVREVAFQSVYRGPGLEPGTKSLAWSVTLRHDDRTLTEPEVRAFEDGVWRALAEAVGGRPRA